MVSDAWRKKKMANKQIVSKYFVLFILDGKGSSLMEDENLRMLCIDPSGNSEESCLLTWNELASVMTNENMTALRSEEIYATLLEIDVLFGKHFPGPAPAFSLYGRYDTVSDVLFPVSTGKIHPSKTTHFELNDTRNLKAYRDFLPHFS